MVSLAKIIRYRIGFYFPIPLACLANDGFVANSDSSSPFAILANFFFHRRTGKRNDLFEFSLCDTRGNVFCHFGV